MKRGKEGGSRQNTLRAQPPAFFSPTHPSASVFRPAATKNGWGRLVDLGRKRREKGMGDTAPKSVVPFNTRAPPHTLTHMLGRRGRLRRRSAASMQTREGERGVGRAAELTRAKTQTSGETAFRRCARFGFLFFVSRGGRPAPAKPCACADLQAAQQPTGAGGVLYLLWGEREARSGQRRAAARRVQTRHSRAAPSPRSAAIVRKWKLVKWGCVSIKTGWGKNRK